MVRTVAVLTAALSTIRQADAAASPAASSSPAFVTFVVTDHDRRDPLDETRPRQWNVRLYYEGTPCRGRAPYADDPLLLDRLAAQSYYDVPAPELETWRSRPSPARPGCPAARARVRPLITLSPGFGVAGFNYAMLATRLVAGGFAVAVVEHPYLGISRLPDGRILQPSDDPLLRQDDQRLWSSRIEDWVRDLSVTLDRLERPPVRNLRLQRQGVTAAGHSLGGAVAFDACLADPRISACADFEGAPFGTRTLAGGTQKPMLFVLSRSAAPERPQAMPDFSLPHFAFLSRGGRSAWAVSMTGGSHMSFSDAPAVMPSTLSRFGGTLMDADRSMQVYAGMLAAFARAYRPGGGGDEAMRAFLATIPEARGALAAP